MSIPINCPGCQSAFDVPDNLAGKTIRCTSCKAQMPVPAAAAAGAEGSPAKKPFGFGSKSSPAVNAVPKPPPAPAKASPAKPAAKAAVVELDEDDEEDEKPKAKPSRPAAKADGPKKPGITGATRKRRDDDDDDDDDDDTPRRKKKPAKGGSGALIAIIGGGAVALALVAGVGIYFATKDKDDDKKSDTASSTSTSGPPAVPAPPAPPGGGRPGMSGPNGGGSMAGPPGGMRPPTPGGPARPPGGAGAPGGNNPLAGLGKMEKLGTPGEWAAFTGDGFTAEFPGAPETQSQSANGMAVKIAGVNSKGGPGVLVISLQFPPEAAADPTALLNAMATGMSQQPQFQGQQLTNVTVDGHPAKEARVVGGGEEGGCGWRGQGPGVHADAAAARRRPPRPRGPVLQLGQDHVHRRQRCRRRAGRGPRRAGGHHPGRHGHLRRQRRRPTGRLPAADAADAPRRPPLGGSAGGPPGGFQPMPPAPRCRGGCRVGPQPGVGGPMPPGGGPSAANTDGNRKARVSNFYTAAFDTEHKELLTIDERPDGRLRKGWLKRYSLPDFKSVGAAVQAAAPGHPRRPRLEGGAAVPRDRRHQPERGGPAAQHPRPRVRERRRGPCTT
jgi:hypothetical protein